jgi:hypothetical protein
MIIETDVIWNEDVPEDCYYISLPKRKWWLEVRNWKNGRQCLTLCDPTGEERREVERSVAKRHVGEITDRFMALAKRNWKSLHDFARALKSKTRGQKVKSRKG